MKAGTAAATLLLTAAVQRCAAFSAGFSQRRAFWPQTSSAASHSRDQYSRSDLILSTSEDVENHFEDDESDFYSEAQLHSFDSIKGLADETLRAIQKQRPPWVSPTPVQQLAIPNLIINTVDNVPPSVWCQAPTGSGKSAAFCLPLLQNSMRRSKRDSHSSSSSSHGRIANLILCPTRELAGQIASVVEQLALHMNGGRHDLSVLTVHGGVPMEPQIKRLADVAKDPKQRLDVVVATPGRLVDVLTYYSSGRNDLAADAALERRLMDAIEEEEAKKRASRKRGRGSEEVSLSIEQLERIQKDLAKKSMDGYDEVPDNADGRGSMHLLLQNLDCLVLDEADRLLGRAFQKEFDDLMDLVPETVPTWMFSATFPKLMEPRVDAVFQRVGATEPLRLVCQAESQDIAQGETDDGEEVSSSLQKRLDRTVVTRSQKVQQHIGPASTIRQRVFRTETPVRTRALRYLLDQNENNWDRVLVFVATRYATEHVSRKLRRHNIASAELHGKLDQAARMRRLEDFAKGKIRVLVATDVASRGLDIAGLPAVINYDLPRSTSDFVHRVGRTGRAGLPGTAVTFVSPGAEGHWDLIESRHLRAEGAIEREVVPGLEPDEERWAVEAAASRMSTPGVEHSNRGLAHDRMHGGVKGRRKSKKDRLREQAAREAAGIAMDGGDETPQKKKLVQKRRVVR